MIKPTKHQKEKKKIMMKIPMNQKNLYFREKTKHQGMLKTKRQERKEFVLGLWWIEVHEGIHLSNLSSELPRGH